MTGAYIAAGAGIIIIVAALYAACVMAGIDDERNGRK